MSVEQYQRRINSIDKTIADLEKKKGESDKKAADYERKASRVSIPKNASESSIRSKLSQIDRYNKEATKAKLNSADLQKKIADKRIERSNVYKKLQKAQLDEQKKYNEELKKVQYVYEQRIKEIEASSIPKTSDIYNNDKLGDDEEYDVFISHAWEDKESFVDELVNELEKKRVRVWYDKARMKWGDSMREKIDEGLRKSKFGIVVLSPNYIKENKYWTKAELNGLFQSESINGKSILPIWHNLTKQDVINYSPIIANKLAMNTTIQTASEIACELASILEIDNMEEK